MYKDFLYTSYVDFKKGYTVYNFYGHKSITLLNSHIPTILYSIDNNFPTL